MTNNGNTSENSTRNTGKLNVPVNKEQSILPQLMLAVFNEVAPDDLEMNSSLLQGLEEEVMALLRYSNQSIMIMLNLVNQEKYQEILKRLTAATTDSQLREVLILDLLIGTIQEKSESDPV